MSTSIKRVALVAVAALGLGVLSVAPSNASIQAEQLAVSAITASTTVGTATTVVVTHSFLGNAVADTVTATASIVKMPAGNSSLPTWSTTATGTTDAGSPNKVASGLVASTGVSAGTTATYYSANFTLSFNPSVAGDYIIRVTPSGTGVASKDIAITAVAKTIGWNTAYIGATTGSERKIDSTVSSVSAASTTAKARIDVAQGYGATAGLDTATAADAKEVVVTTDKGLVSKTNDFTAGAKSVTTAAGTAASNAYYVFSNGDVGAASVKITVGGVLLATKTVTFTGPATALVATLQSSSPTYVKPSSSTLLDITATDAAGSTVAVPSGLTVKSSDTSVATVVQTSDSVTTITGVAAGTAVITVTDPATSGAATPATYTVTVAPAKSASAPVISFDKTAYAVGELVTMTISSTMADSATATLFSTALVYSAGNIVWSGTAGTGTTHAVVGGKVTYKFYAPAVSGTFTVSGTTGADVALTTAATVTKTVDVLNPGVDAATDAANEASAAASDATDAALAAADAADAATAAAQDAVDAVAALSTQVNKLISALKAQITTLTNLVIKIQKKVKA